MGAVDRHRTALEHDRSGHGRDPGPAPEAPTVAVVDSGIDTTRAADFGTSVVASVNSARSAPTTRRVTSRATARWSRACSRATASTYTGAAPNAPSSTSAPRTRRASRSRATSSQRPTGSCSTRTVQHQGRELLDGGRERRRPSASTRSIRRSRSSGSTVSRSSRPPATSASATAAVDMSLAPGNDPFVITVGALDQHQHGDPSDDTVAAVVGVRLHGRRLLEARPVAPGR